MNDNGSICLVTVDGTDFRIYEPRPSIFPQRRHSWERSGILDTLQTQRLGFSQRTLRRRWDAHEDASKVAQALEAGMVGINRGQGSGGGPWVGAKQSGYGYHGTPDGHRQFTQIKIIAAR